MNNARRVCGFLLLHNSDYYPVTYEILINVTDIISVSPLTNKELSGGNAEILTVRRTIRVEETFEEIIRLIELPAQKCLPSKQKEHPQ